MVSCEECLKSSLVVHFLVLMFGAGAWIAVNGVWVELPIIVDTAPESWNLPSYLTVIAQVANVGPIIVTLMQALCPRYFHQNAMIYSIVVIGTVSCLLLSFFWDSVTMIQGQLHSVALFILWFSLAFVDCTSSVTFLPFMSTFQSVFLTTYFVGEGLSGLLPSVFALAQGVQQSTCVNETVFNATTNTTSYNIVTKTAPPRFSADIFFILLCIMMAACVVSFALLNHLGVARKFYAAPSASYKVSRIVHREDEGCYNSVEMTSSSESSVKNLNSASQDEMSPSNQASSHALVNESDSNGLTIRDNVYLLSIIFYINAAANGILPSISSYSSLPYGDLAYHLYACLGSMANPVACVIAFFLPMHSFIGLAIMTLGCTGFGGYLILLAVQSPCPVLVNDDSGKALLVLAQVMFVGIVSFIKLSIAQIFRARGKPKSLVWYGAVVQAGSLVGAFTMFPLVNIYNLFTSGDYCTTVCY